MIVVLSLVVLFFFCQAEDGIRVAHEGLEFRRWLFRSRSACNITPKRARGRRIASICSRSLWVGWSDCWYFSLTGAAELNALEQYLAAAMIQIEAEDSGRRTIRAKKLGRCAGSAKKIADLIWERFAFRADSSEVESVLEALEYFAITALEQRPAPGGYWTVKDDKFTNS